MWAITARNWKRSIVTPQTTKYRYRTVISDQWINWKFKKKVGPQQHYFCQFSHQEGKIYRRHIYNNYLQCRSMEIRGVAAVDIAVMNIYQVKINNMSCRQNDLGIYVQFLISCNVQVSHVESENKFSTCCLLCQICWNHRLKVYWSHIHR